LWSKLLIKLKRFKNIIDVEFNYLSEERKKQLFWALIFLGITILLKILSSIAFSI